MILLAYHIRINFDPHRAQYCPGFKSKSKSVISSDVKVECCFLYDIVLMVWFGFIFFSIKCFGQHLQPTGTRILSIVKTSVLASFGMTLIPVFELQNAHLLLDFPADTNGRETDTSLTFTFVQGWLLVWSVF